MSNQPNPSCSESATGVPVDRRDFLHVAGATTALAAAAGVAEAATPSVRPPAAGPQRTYLTSPPEFRDVSRGNPRPYTLKGEQLVQARLTPDTWRLEIVSDGTTQI